MRSSLLLLSLGILAACDPKEEDSGTDSVDTNVDDTGDTNTDTGDTDTGGMETSASVRVMHLSPDAPAVDVFIDGVADPVVTDLAFQSGTGWLSVPAGTYTFKVAPAGAGVESAVLTVADLALADGSATTAVAYDNVANLSAKALSEDSAGLASGSFRVNVMHGAPGVGEVDIWALTESGASPLLENVPFGANAELDLPAGAYRVGFDVNNDAIPDLSFSLPELTAGLYVNLYAANDVAGNVFLLAQLPDGTVARVNPDPVEPPPSARLRVLHLSPDAPEVDVYVDGISEPVLTNVAFGEGSAYLDVPAGSYTVRVSAAGTGPDAAVLVVDGLALLGGASYTAVAYDEVGSLSALALLDDAEGIASGTFRAQVVHAAAAVGQVDIWEVSGVPTPLIVDFDFGSVTQADLPVSPYNLGFDVNNDASPDLYFAIPALPDGALVNVFAVNDAGGNVFLLAQFDDGSLVQIDPAAV